MVEAAQPIPLLPSNGAQVQTRQKFDARASYAADAPSGTAANLLLNALSEATEEAAAAQLEAANAKAEAKQAKLEQKNTALAAANSQLQGLVRDQRCAAQPPARACYS